MGYCWRLISPHPLRLHQPASKESHGISLHARRDIEMWDVCRHMWRYVDACAWFSYGYAKVKVWWWLSVEKTSFCMQRIWGLTKVCFIDHHLSDRTSPRIIDSVHYKELRICTSCTTQVLRIKTSTTCKPSVPQWVMQAWRVAPGRFQIPRLPKSVLFMQPSCPMHGNTVETEPRNPYGQLLIDSDTPAKSSQLAPLCLKFWGYKWSTAVALAKLHQGHLDLAAVYWSNSKVRLLPTGSMETNRDVTAILHTASGILLQPANRIEPRIDQSPAAINSINPLDF